ncbi:hypothetical protein ABBQ32_010456 [Trebouxia sp. C0010 RCD-2024]
MADQSDKELAAVFDLLKISLSKADPTLDKSNALKGLVVAAVGRAEAAGELKGGNPNQIATDVCITLRHLTGGLLAAGESCSDTGLKVRPYVSVTKKHSRGAVSGDTIVNFALRELGSAGIKSKSDVAKMKAADIKLLAEYLQQHLDHDPQNDCISARRSRPRSILHPPDRLGAVTAKWAPFQTLDC